MPCDKLPAIENVSANGWDLRRTAVTVTFGEDGCGRPGCRSYIFFQSDAVRDEEASQGRVPRLVRYTGLLRTEPGARPHVIFDRIASALFAVHTNPASVKQINHQIYRHLVDIACVYGLGCAASPTVVALFPIDRLQFSVELNTPARFPLSAHSSVNYRGRALPLSYCAVSDNSAGVASHVLVRCGRLPDGEPGMGCTDTGARTVTLSVDVDELRFHPNQSARHAMDMYMSSTGTRVAGHGIVYDAVARDYLWMLPQLRAQKFYALPETVRFGLTQMLRPNEMNGVTYANVLHSLFVETDRHAEVASLPVAVVERESAVWAIRTMILGSEEESERLFAQLVLSADSNFPSDDNEKIMFNRTYSNPRFCAMRNESSTLVNMACLLSRMGLTEGVLTDPYAGVVHACLLERYPSQFGASCPAVPTQASYTAYRQASFGNTHNRLAMSTQVTQRILEGIEAALEGSAIPGRPLQIPLVCLVPSPQQARAIQFSTGSTQNYNLLSEMVSVFTKHTIAGRAIKASVDRVGDAVNAGANAAVVAGGVVNNTVTGANKIAVETRKNAGAIYSAASAIAGTVGGLAKQSPVPVISASVGIAGLITYLYLSSGAAPSQLLPPAPPPPGPDLTPIALAPPPSGPPPPPELTPTSLAQPPSGPPPPPELTPKSLVPPLPSKPSTYNPINNIIHVPLEGATLEFCPANTHSTAFNLTLIEPTVMDVYNTLNEIQNGTDTSIKEKLNDSMKKTETKLTGDRPIMEFSKDISEKVQDVYSDVVQPATSSGVAYELIISAVNAAGDSTAKGAAYGLTLPIIAAAKLDQGIHIASSTAADAFGDAKSAIKNGYIFASLRFKKMFDTGADAFVAETSTRQHNEQIQDCTEYTSYVNDASSGNRLFFSNTGAYFDKTSEVCPPLSPIIIENNRNYPDSLTVPKESVYNKDSELFCSVLPANITSTNKNGGQNSTNAMNASSDDGDNLPDTTVLTKTTSRVVAEVDLPNGKSEAYYGEIKWDNNTATITFTAPRIEPISYKEKNDKDIIVKEKCEIQYMFCTLSVQHIDKKIGGMCNTPESNTISNDMASVIGIIQDVMSPALRKQENKVLADLLTNTIKYHNKTLPANSPIIDLFGENKTVVMSPVIVSRTDVVGSVYKGPDERQPTPGLVGVRVSIEMARLMSTNAQYIIDMAKNALDNLRNSKIQHYNPLQEKLTGLITLYIHIQGNCKSAEMVLENTMSRICVDAKLGSKICEWIMDSENFQDKCGDDCTTVFDIEESVKTNAVGLIIQETVDPMFYSVNRYKTVNQNAQSAAPDQVFGYEYETTQYKTDKSDLKVHGSDFNSIISSATNETNTSAANYNALTEFKNLISKRTQGNENVWITFNAANPDTTDPLSEVFNLLTDATLQIKDIVRPFDDALISG